jgi:hypothetical protein
MRVHPRRAMPFQGRMLRTGSQVHEIDLHPADEYPAVPILIEYAGSDGSGRGHNRSPDIHVLWRYVNGRWDEVARVRSQGPEWIAHLLPIVERLLLAMPAPANQVEIAGEVAARVLEFLDGQLDRLGNEGRERAMSFLFDQFAARMVAEAA